MKIKNLCWIILFLTVAGYTQQKIDSLEKFNFEQYGKLQLDSDETSTINFKYQDKKVKIIYSKNLIAVIEKNNHNKYGLTKTYSPKSSEITTEVQTFADINFGQLKRFSTTGVTYIDEDKNYPFSFIPLISKLNVEFGINLNDEEVSVQRVKKGKVFCYEIIVIADYKPIRTILINASNGNLIDDKK